MKFSILLYFGLISAILTIIQFGVIQYIISKHRPCSKEDQSHECNLYNFILFYANGFCLVEFVCICLLLLGAITRTAGLLAPWWAVNGIRVILMIVLIILTSKVKTYARYVLFYVVVLPYSVLMCFVIYDQIIVLRNEKQKQRQERFLGSSISIAANNQIESNNNNNDRLENNSFKFNRIVSNQRRENNIGSQSTSNSRCGSIQNESNNRTVSTSRFIISQDELIDVVNERSIISHGIRTCNLNNDANYQVQSTEDYNDGIPPPPPPPSYEEVVYNHRNYLCNHNNTPNENSNPFSYGWKI